MLNLLLLKEGNNICTNTQSKYSRNEEYFFSVAAVFKNEAAGIKEWIEHYLNIGAEHIYLINDFSTDNYKEIVLNYPDKITLFNNDIITDKFGRQAMMYEKYLRPVLRKTKYLAILDIDEFLYSPSNKPIKSLLEEYGEFSQIIVKWLIFGSSGLIEQPKIIVDNFLKRVDINNSYLINPHPYKSIVNTKYLRNFSVHKHDVIGHTIELDFISDDLIINHYINQSYNFYFFNKLKKGCADNFQNCDSIRMKSIIRSPEKFSEVDLYSTLFDDRLYKLKCPELT